MKKELIVKNVNINFFSQKEEDFIFLDPPYDTDFSSYEKNLLKNQIKKD